MKYILTFLAAVAMTAIVAAATAVTSDYNNMSVAERVAVNVACANPMADKSIENKFACTIIDIL